MPELTRQTVLDFLAANPEAGTKRDIAKGLGVKGEARRELREILQSLEQDGTLERTGKRAWASADRPPPTGIIAFERIDENGDLIGRAVGRAGPFGPEIRYAGRASKRGRGREPGVGDRALCHVDETRDGFAARMIKLMEKRAGEALIGLYERTHRAGRVTSADKKDKREFLIEEADRNNAEDGDLVRAEPLRSAHRHPRGPRFGVIKEVIGKAGDPRAASLLSIHAQGIPTEFPDEALKQAEAAEATEAPREDLRQVPLITIDPADARDHDDAVFAEQLEDGWRVIVAIADVSAHVPEGSALDQEALKRGNSTYLPDRVVPMLPEALSADACSLREGEDRACLAVEMIFDVSGTKRSHRFMRGLMRSAAKLSYEEAQTAVDGKPGEKAGPLLETVLQPLWGAYAALTKARVKRGPLELELPEKRVHFHDDGTVAGIRVRERFDAHKLIEEMMIQANVAAAETLGKARQPLLYRVHDQPSDAKIAALADFLGTLNIKWPKGQKPEPRRFNKLLADTGADGEHSVMISEMVLRTQAQAIYAPENLGHFGLNLRRYAHFTSPIRRYADLVVHRALIRAEKLGPDGLSDELAVRLEEVAEHLVMTERRSMAAERDAVDRYLALYLADRVGAEFEGRIAGVAKAGLFVRLAETGADGLAPISALSDEYWIHDEAAQSLVATGSGRRYDLGMEVSVRLKEAAPVTGGLILEMLTKPRPKRAGEKAPTRHGSHRHKTAPRRGRRR
ncbi:MAG: ribonuclease R [Pseudomonadota bacterium]